jgi:adenylate cyclase
MKEANRLWAFATVRGDWSQPITSPALAVQVEHVEQGLRLAGLRDHADEYADFGVASDAELRQDLAGLTPTTAPGVTTIRTNDLLPVLAQRKPLVIDTAMYSRGRSIPEAIGLGNAGLGGTFTDGAQHRLDRKIRELTGGNTSTPIVAVGWNSERFDGRNLALRLSALGYTNVHWYRGGREAWEVASLPEADVELHEW